MDLRTTRLVIPACLVIAALAAPARAQQEVVEQGLSASAESVYTPPTCVPGVPFSDITCSTGFDAWIEQFGLDGITAGCGGGKYCPGSTVTRDQMAVFIEKAMRGTGNWPPHTALVFHRPAAEAGSNVNSGTELLAMVAAIPSSGSEKPSATNPWLVRLGPGVFDLGSSALTLPTYTALDGAGRDITVIAGTGAASAGTVNVGDHGTLSRLTVNMTGTGGWGVYLPPQSTSVYLEHVTINAISPSNAVSAALVAFATDINTSFRMVDCEINAHGDFSNYGIDAGSSTDESRLDGVRVNVYGSNALGITMGFIGTGASPVINNSRFTVQDGASVYALYFTGGGGAIDLRNSVVRSTGAGAAIYTDDEFMTLQGDLIDSNSTGIYVAGGGFGTSADISNCNIAGSPHWLHTVSGYGVTVGASKLAGTTDSPTATCLGNYTTATFLASTCP